MRRAQRDFAWFLGAVAALFLIVILIVANKALESYPESPKLAPPVTTTVVESRVSAAEVQVPTSAAGVRSGSVGTAPVGVPAVPGPLVGSGRPAADVGSLDDIDPRGIWRSLGDCESGAWDKDGVPIPGSVNWQDDRGPYEGGTHFSPPTWIAAGGRAYGLHAYNATPYEQVLVARLWLGQTSTEQWPVCSKKVGLRDSDGLQGEQ